MNINYINKLSETETLLLLFVVKDCNPCKLVNTFITNCIFNYKELQFIIIDIHKDKEINNVFNINILPTIIFYHNKKKIKTIIGNEESELLQELKKFK